MMKTSFLRHKCVDALRDVKYELDDDFAYVSSLLEYKDLYQTYQAYIIYV